MITLVYFSNVSGYTKRFVDALGVDATRIPIQGPADSVEEPFVLLTPTYGDSTPGSLVPRQVSRFLQEPEHQRLLTAVIASGNRNFGADYARAGDVLSERFGIPLLHRFELSGDRRDRQTTIERLADL